MKAFLLFILVVTIDTRCNIKNKSRDFCCILFLRWRLVMISSSETNLIQHLSPEELCCKDDVSSTTVISDQLKISFINSSFMQLTWYFQTSAFYFSHKHNLIPSYLFYSQYFLCISFFASPLFCSPQVVFYKFYSSFFFFSLILILSHCILFFFISFFTWLPFSHSQIFILFLKFRHLLTPIVV